MKIQKSLLALAIASAACGPASNKEYPGKALTSVKGVMSARSALTSPVHLALAWYPGTTSNGAATQPKTIVTQELAYQGTFPVSYTFNIYGPPPADVLGDLGGATGSGTGKVAMGILVAYDD